MMMVEMSIGSPQGFLFFSWIEACANVYDNLIVYDLK